ncbi:MAG: prepilin-type N-terminal cleavage/methylation domain-containing protein [Candidatus Electrothrix sp. MAN1_4]|nr:prepilin-type N-terminal cleavage/methylation domain-containing protein [Candidatus Electrothrix sp. MAN1_4]
MQESGGTRKEIGGFSFVELMVVIALVGILSICAVRLIFTRLDREM